MTVLGNLLIGLVMLVGLVGAVIQVIPSALVIGGALLAWAILTGGAVAWTVFGVSVLVLVVSTVFKYLVPGKRLARSGTPNSTLITALVFGVVGWFIVPVIGFLIGGIGAVYLLERRRLADDSQAWGATLEVLKTLGLSIVIEVVAALTVITIWLVSLFFV